MPAAAAAPSTGELVLDRYRPLRPLGSGGSGSVWLARDEQTGVDVALKIVARDGRSGSRAEREAAAVARLRHERCQRAYAVASDEEHVYIAYEYFPGRTLRQALRAGELGDAAAIEAAAQVLEALAHAHALGIVHRDVKPANVLLVDGPGVSVRLLDFGLAQFAGADTLTAAGDVPGTLAYISPERLRGERGGPASDVWAVGVILWEALAGWQPFWASSLPATAKKIRAGAPPLPTARPDIPRELAAAVDSALAREPERRPSAAALAAALRRAPLRREPAPAPTRPQLPTRADVRGVANRVAPAALAALAVAWTAATLPFYPAGWPLGLAALAAALALAHERSGLAFALAVPVFPLGNISRALAVVYGMFALAWLLLHARRPRYGLAFALGPLLAPLSAFALLPAAVQPVGSAVRRAAHCCLAVLLAALVPAVPGVLLDAADEDARTLVSSLWEAAAARPVLAAQALALAALAAVLPLARRHGNAGLAAFAFALLGTVVVPAENARSIALAVVASGLCLALALRPEGAESEDREAS